MMILWMMLPCAEEKKPFIHEKWDINTGILSGDAMLINAYQLFENYEGDTFRELAKLFSKTAIEVCEGQQYDVDFETRDDVTKEDRIQNGGSGGCCFKDGGNHCRYVRRSTA